MTFATTPYAGTFTLIPDPLCQALNPADIDVTLDLSAAATAGGVEATAVSVDSQVEEVDADPVTPPPSGDPSVPPSVTITPPGGGTQTTITPEPPAGGWPALSEGAPTNWLVRRINDLFMWIYNGRVYYTYQIPAATYAGLSTSTGWGGWWTLVDVGEWNVTVNSPPLESSLTAYRAVAYRRGPAKTGLARFFGAFQALATYDDGTSVRVSDSPVQDAAPTIPGDGHKVWLRSGLTGRVNESGFGYLLLPDDTDDPDPGRVYG